MHPFAKRPRDSVAALGEQKLLAAIRRWLGSASPRAPFGIGDDCAVLPATKRRQLITVDPVVYREHFDDVLSPQAAAEKLLKRNVSDIAAMGGRPTAAVISLVLDARTSVDWIEKFYRRLGACARHYGVVIVGGDIAHARGTIVASLTLLGEATGPRVLTRAGARVGDWIFVTGELGCSLPTGHHWKFTPRLAEGTWLAGQRGVRSMIDVSDGLAKDLRALAPRGAAAALDAVALPRRAGAAVRATLTDGEDYELAFTLAARSDREAFTRAWREKFPRTRLSCIGRFVRAGAVPAGALNLDDYRGFEHLR
jgi:thiamine-monophosphate kinase